MKKIIVFLMRLFVILVILVMLLILVIAPLFLVDFFHVPIREFFETTTGFKHYFSGELWLGAVATVWAAVPGICFGLLALIQTKKNFELENRYHRPSIRLNQARITVDRINDRTYKKSNDKAEKDYIESIHKANPEANFMTCSFALEILNDIEIQDIRLRKLDFCLDKQCYSMKLLSPSKKDEKFSGIFEDIKHLRRRSLERTFKEGKRIYILTWDVFPYDLQKDKLKGKEAEFWQKLEWFLNYANWRQEAYAAMELYVQADVSYEYAAKKSEKFYGYIYWDCCQAARFGARAEAESCDGYFSYEPLKPEK